MLMHGQYWWNVIVPESLVRDFGLLLRCGCLVKLWVAGGAEDKSSGPVPIHPHPPTFGLPLGRSRPFAWKPCWDVAPNSRRAGTYRQLYVWKLTTTRQLLLCSCPSVLPSPLKTYIGAITAEKSKIDSNIWSSNLQHWILAPSRGIIGGIARRLYIVWLCKDCLSIEIGNGRIDVDEVKNIKHKQLIVEKLRNYTVDKLLLWQS